MGTPVAAVILIYHAGEKGKRKRYGDCCHWPATSTWSEILGTITTVGADWKAWLIFLNLKILLLS